MFLYKGQFGDYHTLTVAGNKKEAQANIKKQQGFQTFDFDVELIKEVEGYKISVAKN